jgi:hypothetical protein
MAMERQAFEDESLGSTDCLECGVVEQQLQIEFVSDLIDAKITIMLGASQCVNLIEYLINVSKEIPFGSTEEQQYVLDKLIALGLL